jgi:hypothetical protein
MFESYFGDRLISKKNIDNDMGFGFGDVLNGAISGPVILDS